MAVMDEFNAALIALGGSLRTGAWQLRNILAKIVIGFPARIRQCPDPPQKLPRQLVRPVPPWSHGQ
jgi:hypothetical protein